MIAVPCKIEQRKATAVRLARAVIRVKGSNQYVVALTSAQSDYYLEIVKELLDKINDQQIVTRNSALVWARMQARFLSLHGCGAAGLRNREQPSE